MNNPFILIISLVTFFALESLAQQSKNKFGKNEIIEDLDYLNNSLKNTHYNLYAYTSEEDFSENFKKVKKSMNSDTVTLLQATTIFQKVVSVVNNGHTEIDFPGASYRDYAYSGGTIFPLEIAFENNKSFIRKNFSDNKGYHVRLTMKGK